MIFSCIENQTVELKIVNYQYPEVTTGDWDGNWLNIYINVKSKVGNWQTVDPSLTTWEVQDLINWFSYLSKDQNPEQPHLTFTEPNLSFELLTPFNSHVKEFRIKFDLESRPRGGTDDKEFFVDCMADNSELIRILANIKQELSKFPERRRS